MTEELKTKRVQITIKESLASLFIEKAKEHKMSLNSYINFALSSFVKNEKPLYAEVINRLEKKEIASRSYFTQSEMELLKKYAEVNEWSVSKEVRYRTISTLAQKPKLNPEELKAIYNIRSSINVLGANINRLVRDSMPITDSNIKICQNLVELISELKNRISYLEKCNHSSFRIKEI